MDTLFPIRRPRNKISAGLPPCPECGGELVGFIDTDGPQVACWDCPRLWLGGDDSPDEPFAVGTDGMAPVPISTGR